MTNPAPHVAALVFLLIGPACAQETGPVAATLQGGYADDTTGGRQTNDWSALGTAVLTRGSFNAQIDGAYDSLDMPAFGGREVAVRKGIPTLIERSTRADGSQWQYGGDFFWRGEAGILGINASGTHASSTTSFITISTPPGGAPVPSSSQQHSTFENVGLFGEWFLQNDFTFRAKAGALIGDMHGYYGDTAIVYYPMPQISLSAGAGYALVQDAREKDAAVVVEYLPVPVVPVTFQLTYTFARYRGPIAGVFEDDNVFGAALKVYFGAGGDSLRDYQREGASDWDGTQHALTRFAL